MLDLIVEKKYYDCAKLNFKYQKYDKTKVKYTVNLMLEKLKEDMLKISENKELSERILQKFNENLQTINKIC